MESADPDVIVIGSGVLGSSMATMMARSGYRVVVIERDLSEPNRIIGELLQPGGCRALRQLGLYDCLDNLDGHTIKGYIIHDTKRNTRVEVPYSMMRTNNVKKTSTNCNDTVDATHDITEGKAFHHGRFVMALRELAMAEKNIRYIEGRVTKLMEENEIITGVTYTERHQSEPKELRAPLTVVADGCFSKFRKGLIKNKPATKSHFIGILMQNCPQWKVNHAELVLLEPSPVLIYQISSQCTRILVDIKGDLPKDIKEHLAENIYPQLPEHIQEPFMDAIQNDNIRSMPNSYLPPSAIQRAGVMCLGDAFSMRHPLTGGGMTVALNDVALCQELFKDIPDLRCYDKVLEAGRILYSSRKNNHAFVVDVLSMALYELFAADDESLSRLKTACFDYFKLGGECVKGPVGLLSILNPRPHVLLYHFFAVSMYAILQTFRANPWWAVHRSMIQSTSTFYRACGLICPLVWSEI